MEQFVMETRDLITKVRDDDQGGMPERQEQNCSDGDDLPRRLSGAEQVPAVKKAVAWVISEIGKSILFL